MLDAQGKLSVLRSQHPVSRVRKGLHRAPNAAYWLARGEQARAAGDAAQAHSAFERAITIAPTCAEAHAALAGMYHHSALQGPAVLREVGLARAETHLREALCHAPKNGSYWAALATLLVDRGAVVGAATAYHTALARDPACRAAQQGLALLVAVWPELGDLAPAASTALLQYDANARR